MGKAGLSDIWQTDAGAMHHYDTAVGILRHPPFARCSTRLRIPQNKVKPETTKEKKERETGDRPVNAAAFILCSTGKFLAER